MKLYQLADDHKEYGDRASWWLVVSDDGDDELAGPFETREEAEKWIERHPLSSHQSTSTKGE